MFRPSGCTELRTAGPCLGSKAAVRHLDTWLQPNGSPTISLPCYPVLQSAFGEALKGVQQVGAQDTSATLASVDAHLDMLRPAISNYGGSIVVRSKPSTLHLPRTTCTPRSMLRPNDRQDPQNEVARHCTFATAAVTVGVAQMLESGRAVLPERLWNVRVQVRTLQGGVCTVKYDGPPPIAMGIKVCSMLVQV